MVVKKYNKNKLLIVLAMGFAGIAFIFFAIQTYTPKLHLTNELEPKSYTNKDSVNIQLEEKQIALENVDSELLDMSIYSVDDPIDDWSEMQALLRESNDGNDLLLAAFYAQSSGALGSTDNNLAESLLLKAFELEPNNPLVSHQIYQFCANNINFSICGLPYLEKIEELNVNNGLVISQVAISYYNNGDLAKAHAALKQAGSATESSNFYSQYLKALDDSFVKYAKNKNRDLETFSFYLGIASALSVSELNDFYKICDERAQLVDTDWKSDCYNSGKVIAEYSKTEIETLIGVSIKKRYSNLVIKEMQNELTEVNQSIEGERENTNQALLDLVDTNPVITNDIWSLYLNKFDELGEQQALSLLSQLLTAE